MLDLADRLGTKYQILHPKADCLVATVSAISRHLVNAARMRVPAQSSAPGARACAGGPFAQARARISPGPYGTKSPFARFALVLGGWELPVFLSQSGSPRGYPRVGANAGAFQLSGCRDGAL